MVTVEDAGDNKNVHRAGIIAPAFFLSSFSLYLNGYGEYFCRHGRDAIELFHNPMDSKQIPFFLEIKLPPPLRRGIDYGITKDNRWVFTVDKKE
jgi:hypothetical protein